MTAEEVVMPDVGVNSISVLGRELLLVDVGGGAETHLAATDDQPTRGLPWPRSTDSASSAVAAGYDQGVLLARRWAPSTLCGRAWWEMAAGDAGTFRRWQEVALAPSCRSCLRLDDAWFPTAEAPRGVELLASVAADTVETFDVPPGVPVLVMDVHKSKVSAAVLTPGATTPVLTRSRSMTRPSAV